MDTFGSWHLSRQTETDLCFVDITTWIKGCQVLIPILPDLEGNFFHISCICLILYASLHIKIREVVKKLVVAIQEALPQLDSKTVLYVSSLAHARAQL